MNWTKVGLKVDQDISISRPTAGLNWTKVGLKAGVSASLEYAAGTV